MTNYNPLASIEDQVETVSETAGEESEIQRLASQINIYSMPSIQDFGSEIAQRTGQFTDQVLEQARAGDLDETGNLLTEIVLAAQEFHLDSFENTLARTPIVSGLFKRFAKTREKAINRFETVKAQVDRLVNDVEKTAAVLEGRNNDYQSMYESVQDEHKTLGLHIQAIKIRLADIEADLPTVTASEDDLESTERAAVLEAGQHALLKRSDDLTVLQHSALQMLPMIRIIQSNTLTLIDKFQTIQQLTLPAWKRAFMLALALDEQRNAVKLANSIDDTTNKLLRTNANLLHQNAVSTAKSNQRLVIDIETLRDVHDKIILTLKDVRKAHEDGDRARKDALAELQTMRQQMLAGAQTSGEKNAA